MRPRERYLHYGPEGLGDDELLALVVGLGQEGRTARAIARALFDRFGDLASLQEAPPLSLCAVDGIGPALAVRLHAALQAGVRAARAGPPEGPPVDGPNDAWTWLAPRFAGRAVEELHALLIDRRRRAIGVHLLSRGSDVCTVVDPRQVFRIAIACRAAAVVVAHNHPSGDPTPSERDRDVTACLVAAGDVVGVPLVDHIVVAGEAWTSMALAGIVPAPRDEALRYLSER